MSNQILITSNVNGFIFSCEVNVISLNSEVLIWDRYCWLAATCWDECMELYSWRLGECKEPEVPLTDSWDWIMNIEKQESKKKKKGETDFNYILWYCKANNKNISF